MIPCQKLWSQCSALCFIHSLNKCSLSSFPVPGIVPMLEIKHLKEIEKVPACPELQVLGNGRTHAVQESRQRRGGFLTQQGQGRS